MAIMVNGDSEPTAELDWIPVNQLSDRFALARSAVYTRLDALGIKPTRLGRQAYIRSSELTLMDELHRWIQGGRTIPEFQLIKGLRQPEDLSKKSSSEASTELSLVPDNVIQSMTGMFAQLLDRVQPRNPLEYLRHLEEACQQQWLLSTSELADLLKLDPEFIHQQGDRFSDAGYVFTRAGYRANGEAAWCIAKGQNLIQ